MKIYGIPNCNTVKKTLDWFKLHHIEYEFHDFKKLGISNDKLEEWAEKIGWEALLNKRGTTWKMLDADVQSTIVSQKTAIELMKEKTSLIKRPVIETGSGSVFLGYNEDQLSELLK